MKMEEIITPVDKELLKAELNEKRFLRDTNHAGNKLYIVDNACAPNVLREIGRLREIAFRAGGGGTGKSADLDEFDLDGAFKYKQLVLWDPDAECIIGGYRYVLCDNVMYDRFGQPIMPSAHLFKFTRRYLKGAFLKTIELSRSFIRPEYQSSEQGMKQPLRRAGRSDRALQRPDGVFLRQDDHLPVLPGRRPADDPVLPAQALRDLGE